MPNGSNKVSDTEVNPASYTFPANRISCRFILPSWFPIVCGIILLLVVGGKLQAADDPDFLNYLRQPRSLQDVLQPGSTGWYNLAPGKDIVIKQELLYSRKKHDYQNITGLAMRMGFYKLKHYRNSEALDYFLEAYQAALKTKKPVYILNAGLAVAFVQKSIGAYKSANDILTEIRPSLDLLKDAQTNGIVYALMGDNFGWLNDIASCTEAYRRAARSFQLVQRTHEMALCHTALGENQLRLDAYADATASFRSALQLTNEPRLRAIIFRDIGLVDFKQRHFEAAIDDFSKSDNLVPNHLLKKLLKETYMQLFTLYSYENDFVKADKFHDLYLRKKSELENSGLSQLPAERSQIIRMLQYKRDQRDSGYIAGQQLELSRMIDKRDMDLQKKEQELALKINEADSLSILNAQHELDISKKEAQISRYQNTRNMLVAIALIAVLLVILFYNRYKLRKKSNEALARKNEELVQTLEKLRRTQDQLIHSEKMAGLGKLTAGIAHEIQNPLNFVRNFSESGIELFEEYNAAATPEQKSELYNEIRETLGRIRHHAGRADGIVKSMLQHSRSGGTKLEKTDLNQMLQDSVQLSFHSMRATLSNFQCRIEENLGTLPEVEVLPQQLSRVMLNLSNNAFYAMFEESNGEAARKDSCLKISTRFEDETVFISFEDNGPGIPPENLQHIFEPFYTTKPAGKGTGLGLSISYDVLRQHGGDLKAESIPGQGAKFTLILPVNQTREMEKL